MTATYADTLAAASRLADIARYHKREVREHRKAASDAMERRRVLLAHLESFGIETEIKKA